MVQLIFHVWKVHVVVVYPLIQAPQHESSSRPLARTTVAARELQTLGRRPTSRLTGDTLHDMFRDGFPHVLLKVYTGEC